MRKIPNYMEDFDAAKQLARQTAEEAKRAGRASRWTDSPTIHREDATTQRGRVVQGEPSLVTEPGPVAGLRESELTNTTHPVVFFRWAPFQPDTAIEKP